MWWLLVPVFKPASHNTPLQRRGELEVKSASTAKEQVIDAPMQQLADQFDCSNR